jgi:hypothetical protein
MSDNGNNQTASEVEVYPLDDALIGVLRDVAEQMQTLQKAADKLHAQREGALCLFVRQHRLEGDWRVAPNGKELMKQAPATEAK